MGRPATGTDAPEPDISIGAERYRYLKRRLAGGAVYASADRRPYLRAGDAAAIRGEVARARDLADRGFPLPRIRASGTLADGRGYFVEPAIGDRVFGELFRAETAARGRVADATFDRYTRVMEWYCAAQCAGANAVPPHPDLLAQMVPLANALRNNPPSPPGRAAFDAAYALASRRVGALRWGYALADLNPFNVLPGGVIDLELAGCAPVGYDAVTGAYFGRMWPAARVAYAVTDAQIARYRRRIEAVARRHGVATLGAYRDDFLVLKAIWGTAKEHYLEHHPGRHAGFWRWRVAVRDWCVAEFLAGRTIDTRAFEAVGVGATVPRRVPSHPA